MSIDAMKQALEALEFFWDNGYRNIAMKQKAAMDALRERLAQPNEFSPDWDAMAVMVAEQQRMATEIERLKDGFNKSESRLHDVAVHCERVKRRLKDVNTAAMAKRQEPIHDMKVFDLADQYLYGGKNYGILEFARAIEKEHGIGASDE